MRRELARNEGIPRGALHPHRADDQRHRLWGPRIRNAYADLGVLPFAEVSLDNLAAQDETVANDFDRTKRL